MKQSQKNIQIVKVQVGDLRKKRKAKKKGKGKAKVFSGTGLAPVLGQPQFFTPPMFPNSRAGTQFEPPRLQVVEKKEDPLKDAEMTLDQLKKLQERMKEKNENSLNDPLKDAEMTLDQLKKLQERMKEKNENSLNDPYFINRPSPFNVPSSAPPSPFEAGNYFTVYRGTDTPRQPIDMPQQPLVAAEAASSSSSSQQYSRSYLRGLKLTELKQLGDSLGIAMPPLTEIKNRQAGQPLLKERYVEIIHSYKPSR